VGEGCYSPPGLGYTNFNLGDSVLGPTDSLLDGLAAGDIYVGGRFWDRRDIYSGGPLDTAGDRPSSPPPRYNSRTEQVADRQDTAGDRPFSPPQLQQQTRAGSRQKGNIAGNKVSSLPQLRQQTRAGSRQTGNIVENKPFSLP
jgi:hypothetical protein